MIKEGLEYVAGMVRKAEKIQTIEHAGLTYADRNVTRLIDELPVNEVKTIEVSTLSALASYVEHDIDRAKNLFVQVVSPTVVEVHTPALGEKQTRQTWIRAKALVPKLLLTEDAEAWKLMPAVVLATHLRTCFVESDARDDLVKFLGTWVETDSIETEDDGVTQQVVMRSGISLNKEGKAPSLMDLSPIRTFHEVEQPASPFVLRCEKGGRAALFTADGGAWRIEATRTIAEVLRAALPKEVVVLD